MATVGVSNGKLNNRDVRNVWIYISFEGQTLTRRLLKSRFRFCFAVARTSCLLQQQQSRLQSSGAESRREFHRTDPSRDSSCTSRSQQGTVMHVLCCRRTFSSNALRLLCCCYPTFTFCHNAVFGNHHSLTSFLDLISGKSIKKC